MSLPERRILVCGSRTWRDEEPIIDALVWHAGPNSSDVEVIHGAQVSRDPDGTLYGADYLAGEIAKDFGCRVREFPADWSLGKRGGPERNKRMLDEKPDLVLAFHENGSRGTQHTIDEARRRGIPVEVIER